MQEFPQSLASWPWETESDSTLSHHRGLHSSEPSWFLAASDGHEKGHFPSFPVLEGGAGEGRGAWKGAPGPALAQSTHTAATRLQVQFILHNREIQRAEGLGFLCFLPPLGSSPIFDLFLLPTPFLKQNANLVPEAHWGGAPALTSLPPRCRLRSQQTVFSFLIT